MWNYAEIRRVDAENRRDYFLSAVLRVFSAVLCVTNAKQFFKPIFPSIPLIAISETLAIKGTLFFERIFENLLRNAKNILSFFSKKVNFFVVFQKIYDICNSKSQTTFLVGCEAER